MTGALRERKRTKNYDLEGKHGRAKPPYRRISVLPKRIPQLPIEPTSCIVLTRWQNEQRQRDKKGSKNSAGL
jgi:hypothetical protein